MLMFIGAGFVVNFVALREKICAEIPMLLFTNICWCAVYSGRVYP